jgi:ABC-type bacteriocin/lantibiotic exporter with double-glycine peptidase domain
MSESIPLPHFQQSAEGYCLPACARMILAYLGKNLAEDSIAKILGTQEFGTPSFAIRKLSALTLEVEYQEWSIPQMLTAIRSNRPLIAYVQTGFLEYFREGDVTHSVIIVGATEEQSFMIHDPSLNAGPTIVSWNGLLAAWAEFSYRGATLTNK